MVWQQACNRSTGRNFPSTTRRTKAMDVPVPPRCFLPLAKMLDVGTSHRESRPRRSRLRPRTCFRILGDLFWDRQVFTCFPQVGGLTRILEAMDEVRSKGPLGMHGFSGSLGRRAHECRTNAYTKTGEEKKAVVPSCGKPGCFCGKPNTLVRYVPLFGLEKDGGFCSPRCTAVR